MGVKERFNRTFKEAVLVLKVNAANKILEGFFFFYKDSSSDGHIISNFLPAKDHTL